MQDEKERLVRITPAWIVFIILEMIFLIFAFITIKSLTTDGDEKISVRIEQGFDQMDEFDLGQKDRIRQEVYDLISLNFKNIDSIPLKNGAIIRDNEVKKMYLKNAKINLVSFVIDIESLGQSYQVVYFWSNDKQNAFMYSYDGMLQKVFCVEDNKRIYDDFECKDYSKGRGGEEFVRALLPLQKFQYAFVRSEDNIDIQGRDVRFELMSMDKDAARLAIEEMKDFIESLGLDAEKYTFTHDVLEGQS